LGFELCFSCWRRRCFLTRAFTMVYFGFFFFFFFDYRGCPGQLARTSTNPTGPEVNDHVSLQ